MSFNNKYKKIKIIGKGSFGNIYKVLDNETNKFYALKLITIVNNDDLKKFEIEYKKEIEIMKKIKNKYIIKLKDNFYDEAHDGYCIVMELCDGNLRNILQKYKPKGLPLKLVNKIFIQLNEALKTMINKQFIHRDLKPENILIKYTDTNKTNFDIKLTDFGFSTNEINSSIHTYSFAGSVNYIAPEIETNHYNNKCDLWSLGIILYELYTNKYIFDSNIPIEREMNRYKGNIVKETDNEMINKLIKKIIQVDIEKRIGWEEYFDDDFFKIKEVKDKKEESNLISNL
jgi:serine/threonine protein kinase